jgi:hypothetical protein
MNLKLSGLGAEPKKLVVLGILLAAAAYFYFSNSTPSDSGATPPRASATEPAVASPRIPVRQVSRSTRLNESKSFRNAGEFKPSLKPPKDFENQRASIDPTLHLDLLAKLQKVKVEGGNRSLFAFGEEAAPAKLASAEPGKIIPKKKVAFIGPPPPPPPPPPKVDPPPPPIPLKFYGFVAQSRPGARRAFFMDGEDIIVATEGQMIKNRYKIVKIGVNSAVVEDTQFKNHQQTLPLVEEITG